MSADPLAAERAAALAQIESLTREFDGVVAASQASNADDEHDPEGATIAFERSQVETLARRLRCIARMRAPHRQHHARRVKFALAFIARRARTIGFIPPDAVAE